MAKCSFCHSETHLHMSGIPMCLACAAMHEGGQIPLTGEEVRTLLLRDLSDATLRVRTASTEYEAVIASIPSMVPHPDGTQRIKNASNELSVARREMMRAHARFNEYLSRGTVPEDLQGDRHR